MRGAGILVLLLLLGPGPARAGFGLPETEGLYRLPTAEAPVPGRLAFRIHHDYYLQDVGQGSRFHFFHGRAAGGLGLFPFLEAGLALDLWGRHRAASGLDTPLYDAIGGSDWSRGLGDGEAWLRLAWPLPWEGLRLGAQASMRLGMGDETGGLGAGASDLEWRLLGSMRLAEEPGFVETWLHLAAGRRLNRGEAGWGLAPSLDPEGPWSPWPSYYPAETESTSRDQILLCAGLEFLSRDFRLFGELIFEGYDEALEMSLRENVWLVSLGLSGPFYAEMEFGIVFQMSLARDDFETGFEPHYPRLAHSVSLSRDFSLF